MNNATDSTTGTVLVIGGTGKSGRRVAARLTDLGHPVRIGSRYADLPFHWENPASWRPVLEGVSSVYIAYSPDISAPGAPENLGAFAELAAATGVRRLVLLSAIGLGGALKAEEAVRRAGVDCTVLRGTWFAQIFSEEFPVEEIRTGSLTFPAGETAVPFTDLDDLAEAAVTVLTEDGHAGQTYEVTGRRAVTFREVAEELSRVTGREVRYQAVSPGEYIGILTGVGVPEEIAELVAGIAEETLSDTDLPPADGIRRLLGRAPKDFTEYAERAARTGAWQG